MGWQGRMRAGLLVDHTGPDAPLGLAVSFLLELIQKSTELGWGSLCIWRVERRRKRPRREWFGQTGPTPQCRWESQSL